MDKRTYADRAEQKREYRARRRQRAIDFCGGRCELCGGYEALTFHHLTSYEGKHSPNGSRGGMRQLKEVEMRIYNGGRDTIKLLCKDCHKLQHRGAIAW